MNEMQLIEKWNALTGTQKAELGDRYITHDTNLRAWVKPFNELSPLKQKRVLQSMANPNLLLPGIMIGTGL